jgi:small subunit ribosomal protein S20
MPQHKSAERRIRTSRKKNLINKSYKTQMKNVIKKIKELKDKEVALKELKNATALLDKLSSKKIIHKNKAANQKSQLAKLVNKLATKETAAPAKA